MHRLWQKHSIGILLVIGLDRNHWALQCMQLASGRRKCYVSLRPNNNQIDASDLNVWRPALLYAKINGCVFNHLLPYLSICCFERIRVNIFQVGYSFMKCTQKVYTKQSNTSVWNTFHSQQLPSSPHMEREGPPKNMYPSEVEYIVSMNDVKR